MRSGLSLNAMIAGVMAVVVLLPFACRQTVIGDVVPRRSGQKSTVDSCVFRPDSTFFSTDSADFQSFFEPFCSAPASKIQPAWSFSHRRRKPQ